jgi:hypothetical protein
MLQQVRPVKVMVLFAVMSSRTLLAHQASCPVSTKDCFPMG